MSKPKPDYSVIDWDTAPPEAPRAAVGGPKRIELLRDNLVTVVVDGVCGRWYQIAAYATRVSARRCVETISEAHTDRAVRDAMRATRREFGAAKVARLDDGKYAAMVYLDDVDVEGDVEAEGGGEE